MMLPLLLDQLRYQTSPTGLMTRADARAVIAVEIFMEGNVVAPVWVILKSLIAPEDRAASIFVAQENVDETM